MRGAFITTLAALLVVTATAQAQQPTGRDSVRAGHRDSTRSMQANRDGQTEASKPVDINTATHEQLVAAGWGQYADAIIAGRPYTNMNELLTRNIVPETAFEQGSSRFKAGEANTTGESRKSNDPTSEDAPSPKPAPAR